jgi:hypothetical protein
MNNEKKEWLTPLQAFEQGKILNRWGQQCTYQYIYKLIEKNKLQSKIENNQILILC